MLFALLLCKFSLMLLSMQKSTIYLLTYLSHSNRDTSTELTINTTYILELFKKNVQVGTFLYNF